MRLRRKYDPFEKVAILERTTGKKNARALILLPSRLPEGAENPLPGRVVGHRKMIETTKVKLWSYVISLPVIHKSELGRPYKNWDGVLRCETNEDRRVWSLRCSG